MQRWSQEYWEKVLDYVFRSPSASFSLSWRLQRRYTWPFKVRDKEFPCYLMFVSDASGKSMFWRFLGYWKCEEARLYFFQKQLASNWGWRTDTVRWSSTLKELIDNGGERVSSIDVSKVPGIYISEAFLRQWGLQFWMRSSVKKCSPVLDFRKAEWSVLRNRAQRWN